MRGSSGLKTALAGCALACAMAAPAAAAQYYDDGGYHPGPAYRYEHHETTRRVADDSYVFSTVRMVDEWDAPAAIKVPLLPPAAVIDIVFLPAEIIADAVR